jgi:hypothetical protein
MNQKKTRKFLVATSALVGAMSGVAAQAMPATEEGSTVAATTISVSQDFVVGPTMRGTNLVQDTGHQSHASHSSHASHASHVSSSQ